MLAQMDGELVAILLSKGAGIEVGEALQRYNPVDVRRYSILLEEYGLAALMGYNGRTPMGYPRAVVVIGITDTGRRYLEEIRSSTLSSDPGRSLRPAEGRGWKSNQEIES